MSRRSCLVGVRNQTWRPMRPGRVSAGSSIWIGTLQAPMKKICSGRGARRLEPQTDAADPRRDDVDRVEERVHATVQRLAQPRRVADPVHDDEQLVQRELTAAHHPRHHLAEDPPASCRSRRLPLGEEALAPRTRLENQVAARVERAERAVEGELLERRHVRAAAAAGRRATVGACRPRRSRR